uniref:peptide chain release factor 1-like, mitochondrial isoform X2 n=1 Tax=Pristiophorus japonicus TaxID=55135 RepID=UPI00398E541F
MLPLGWTLLTAASSRFHARSCLAKLPLHCFGRCFFRQLAGHWVRCPPHAHRSPAPGPARAFSAGVLEGLFVRSSLQGYLSGLEREYAESVERLDSCQGSPEEEEEERARALRRRVTELAPVVTELQQLRLKVQELQDIESLLKDEDADLKGLAESEESSCQEAIRALKSKIISLLIPSEEADNNDLILELTAGVGGQESMLFTAEMFTMYQNYAAYKHWHFEVLEYRHSELGVVAECQQERSQLKNREKTMQMLRAKLYSRKLEEQTSKRHSARKIQIGTKGRSEKIRTYNFPQDRITDHRIGKSLYELRSFMLGEELLDEMVEELKGLADAESLLELLEQSTNGQQDERRHQ